jgi:ABC-type phosphate/phosphonate transport system permease subunit
VTDPVEDLIRITLSELAEETPVVRNPASHVMKEAGRRRAIVLALSAAGAVAAVAIATPLAMAATQNHPPTPASVTTAVPSSPSQPIPSPSGPSQPIPSPRS